MKVFLQVLALACILATVLPFLRLPDWWVRAFDFPRMQIAVAGSVVLVGYGLVWDVGSPLEGALFFILGASAVYQGGRMLPYTPLYPKQVLRAENHDLGDDLSLLVANVYMENRDAELLLDLVRCRSPDVVLAVETDVWWQEKLAVLRREYPHTLEHPLSNTYGLLFYSRLPFDPGAVEFLVADDIPSVHVALQLSGGRRTWLHGLHPRPPAPSEASDTVERDGELLLVAQRVARHRGPSIVTGDLNDVAWSSTTALMQRISGLLDPRIGRGVYSTFHAKLPLLRWPLDHVFHSDHFQLVRLERLGPIGSDHFPIFAHLALTPEAQVVHDPPEPEPGDHRRAREKIVEALES